MSGSQGWELQELPESQWVSSLSRKIPAAGEEAAASLVSPKQGGERCLGPSSHCLCTDGWTDRLLEVDLFPEKPTGSPSVEENHCAKGGGSGKGKESV